MALMSLAGCENSKSEVKVQADPPRVGTISLHPETLQLKVELPGRTRATEGAEIRPQVTGILLKKAFDEGAYVKKGQLLYQIDAAPYRAALARAHANYHSAEALIKRYKTLIETSAISRQQFDDAQSRFMEAKADLEVAQINLDYTRIVAPISGRIGRSSVTQGALVIENQSSALAVIQQLDPIYVDVVQPASMLLQRKNYLSKHSAGPKDSNEHHSAVYVALEDGAKYGYAGKLQFSEVQVDESTGAVTLRVLMPNPEHILLPGMFVRAELESGSREQAILIPQKAVSRNSRGETSVFLVDSENVVSERKFQAERLIQGRWLTDEPFAPGSRIIVNGIQHVKAGMKVDAYDVGATADRLTSVGITR